MSKTKTSHKEKGDRRKRRKTKPIGEKTINKLLTASTKLRDRVIISFLINTGLRRVDIAKLKLRELNLVDGTLTIIQKKTGELAYLPLPEQLISDLRIYINENLKPTSEWLFLSPKKSKHLSRRQINNVVDTACKKAGVTDVTPHDFRATFMTVAGKRGIPPKMIVETLGVSYNTVMRYYQKFTLEEIKEQFAKVQKG